MPFNSRRTTVVGWLSRLALAVVLLASLGAAPAHAVILTQQGDVTVTARVLLPPPTDQAVITQPTTGTHLQTTPVVLHGTCGPDLLVRVFNNGTLAGSIACSSTGDFTMNITLNIGTNVLHSLNYNVDELPGPDAPDVTLIVDQPATSVPGTDDEGKVLVVGDDGVVREVTPGQDQAIDNTVIPGFSGKPDYQRMFEGTVLEPLAKALDVSVAVAPNVNTGLAIVTNGLFLLALLGILLLILL